MKYTISANYLDRSSPFRWLVRREDQTPQEAIACKRVVAVNVSFKSASHVESALGCSEVAVTETEPTMEGIKPAEGIDEKAEHDEAVGTTATAAPAEVEADPVHNPKGVSLDEVPEGYRFARQSEIDNQYHPGSKYYSGGKFKINFSCSRDGAYHTKVDTIIVPITPPVAEAAPVAVEAQASNETAEKLVKLKFEGLFYRMGANGACEGKLLDGVQKLVLEEDGSIFGVL